ncbi:MAG: S-layer homology domain-containing protein [Clostridiales bacterium]|jgi:hypothetical protein|nr:S-layer homology domain-containing protein [Clostridiales bacterium]
MKRIVLTALLSLAVIHTSAFAEAALTASVRGYEVSASLTGAAAGCAVTYTVYAPGDTLPAGPFVKAGETSANADGSADFGFTLPRSAPSGVYTVSAAAGGAAYEVTFTFRNTALFSGINAAASAEEVKRLLEADGNTLVNMDDYDGIPDDYKIKAAQFIFRQRPSGGYADSDALIDAYHMAAALVRVEAAEPDGSGAAAFFEVVKKYGGILGVDITAPGGDYYKIDAEGADAAKSVFRALTAGKEYRSPTDFQRAYTENILIAFFKTAAWPAAQNYTALTAASALSFDTGEKYQALQDKSLPFKAIIDGRNGISEVSDIDRLFNGGVTAAYDAQNKSDNSGKTTSPGGGVPSGNTTAFGSGAGRELPQPLPPDSADGIFSDLGGSEWAAQYIGKLYSLQIVNGVGEGRFEPEASVTREQFVKMAVTAFAFGQTDGKRKFADVAPDAWYAPYISTAAEAGIVNGVSEDAFGVGLPISRQDMMVMLYRALLAKGITPGGAEELTFADSGMVADYAREALGVMAARGMISGVGGNEVAPLAYATRAEAAKVIALAMEWNE